MKLTVSKRLEAAGMATEWISEAEFDFIIQEPSPSDILLLLWNATQAQYQLEKERSKAPNDH